MSLVYHQLYILEMTLPSAKLIPPDLARRKDWVQLRYCIDNCNGYDFHKPDEQFDATALIWVCWYDNPSIALKLLEKPDMININHIDSFGGSALTWACNNQMVSVAMKIIDHCDPDLFTMVADKQRYTDSPLELSDCDEMRSVHDRMLSIMDGSTTSGDDNMLSTIFSDGQDKITLSI